MISRHDLPRYSTPWGLTDELRRDQLRPGPGADREFVAAHQRNRMMAAAVAAVAEQGYRDTRVTDIVCIAGCSRSAFYKHFSDKADCFRQTVFWLRYKIGAVDLAGAIKWTDKYPACASFYLNAPTDCGRDDVESETEDWAKVFARQTGCPTLVARAVVSAGMLLLSDYLAEGRTAEDFHREAVPVLAELFAARDVPSRRTPLGPPLEAVPNAPRDRMLVAIADLIHEAGGESPTIASVALRARCSLSTFYTYFDGLEDAIEQAAYVAYYSASREPDTDAWLRWLARRPAQARLIVFRGLDRTRRSLPVYADRGRARSAFVRALLAGEIDAGRARTMHRLAPVLDHVTAAKGKAVAA